MEDQIRYPTKVMVTIDKFKTKSTVGPGRIYLKTLKKNSMGIKKHITIGKQWWWRKKTT